MKLLLGQVLGFAGNPFVEGPAAARLLMGAPQPARREPTRRPIRSTPGNARHRDDIGPGFYSMAGHRPARERRVSH